MTRAIKIYYNNQNEFVDKVNDICSDPIVYKINKITDAVPDITTTKFCSEIYLEIFK
ncbi:MAG: hypothetical protein ACOCP4_02015 [Candidatus Woesearchaeota archaeon]